jgi:hypothetical protein
MAAMDFTNGNRRSATPMAEAATAAGPMLTRRTACLVGAGLSASALVGLLDLPGFPDIRYVLTDRRHVESLEFGTILVRGGSQRLEVTEGLTRLWREALAPLWRDPAGAVAGLTQLATWICVAEQARGCRRRPVLVGRRRLTVGGDRAEQAPFAPRAALACARALEERDAPWPLVMARLGAGRMADRGLVSDERCGGALAPATSATLVSWVIA